MAFKIFDGTPTDRTITAMQVIDGGAVDRVITQMRVIDANGTDRLVYSTSPALSASNAPDPATGGTLGTGTAISETVTCTPSGGTGPYTYAWTRISYTSGTAPTSNSAATAATAFTQTGLGPGDTESAVFRCTVTDSLAATATADVTVTFLDFS